MIAGLRIRLRALEREDLRYLWKWENDPEIMEFASCWPNRCVSLPQLEQLLEDSLRPSPGGPWRYVIVAENDVPVGIVTYWIPNTRFNRSAEIGLYIGECAAWGQGYGLDVLMTLAHALFKQEGIHRVGLTFGSYNTRMSRLAAKCGMSTEGITREDRFMHGRFWDTIRVGILSSEFDSVYAAWRGQPGQQQPVNT